MVLCQRNCTGMLHILEGRMNGKMYRDILPAICQDDEDETKVDASAGQSSQKHSHCGQVSHRANTHSREREAHFH